LTFLECTFSPYLLAIRDVTGHHIDEATASFQEMHSVICVTHNTPRPVIASSKIGKELLLYMQWCIGILVAHNYLCWDMNHTWISIVELIQVLPLHLDAVKQQGSLSKVCPCLGGMIASMVKSSTAASNVFSMSEASS
jgi:hypothetical protein